LYYEDYHIRFAQCAVEFHYAFEKTTQRKVDDYNRFKNEKTKPSSVPKRGGKRKAESSNSSTNPNEPPAKLQQTKLFRTVAVVSQTEVDQLVTSYVVKGMHPLSVVEEPAFVELVTGLCPSANVMSRRTLGRRVDDV